MKITDAKIEYFKKGCLFSETWEGVKHVKTLPYLSVVQSVVGSYSIALDRAPAEDTGSGGFFIAPSGACQTIVHHLDPETRRMSCRWVFLSMDVNGGVPIDSLYRFPSVLTGESAAELNRLFDLLFSTDDLWENYACCYRMMGLLLTLAEPIEKSGSQCLQNSVSYMLRNLALPMSVSDLAVAANMSESNYYAAFRKRYGRSPMSYLNHVRLSLATDRLLQTDDAIGEIADSVGIPDSLYFSKLFKKHFGVSPREYRTRRG
ncbi:MAG: helix-turn-helix transcriptional regulator [Clostridia bacterium]|nr:helix-turn-helix transcriptional regulator [Clostridia bacterium]